MFGILEGMLDWILAMSHLMFYIVFINSIFQVRA